MEWLNAGGCGWNPWGIRLRCLVCRRCHSVIRWGGTATKMAPNVSLRHVRTRKCIHCDLHSAKIEVHPPLALTLHIKHCGVHINRRSVCCRRHDFLEASSVSRRRFVHSNSRLGYFPISSKRSQRLSKPLHHLTYHILKEWNGWRPTTKPRPELEHTSLNMLSPLWAVSGVVHVTLRQHWDLDSVYIKPLPPPLPSAFELAITSIVYRPCLFIPAIQTNPSIQTIQTAQPPKPSSQANPSASYRSEKTMRFLSLLTTGLLLAFTSNAQAQCVQGCGNPRRCLRNFGSVSLDRCPGGSNNRFCDCVGDFSCGTEGRGQCTAGPCSGTIQTGLCPFGNDFRCCLPKWEWNGRSERGRKGDKWARAEKKKNHEQGWDDNEGWRNGKRMKEYVVWFGD